MFKIIFILTFILVFNNFVLSVDIERFCITNDNSCPLGIKNESQVHCQKKCDITLHSIINAIKRPICLNNGHYASDMATSCVCQNGYSGQHCEIASPCHSIDCGKYGVCENGVCICDYRFTGERCNIRKSCSPPHHNWNGESCECAFGFTGTNCDKCDERILCVNDGHGIALSTIFIDSDTDVIDFIRSHGDVSHPSPLTPYFCSCEKEIRHAFDHSKTIDYIHTLHLKKYNWTYGLSIFLLLCLIGLVSFYIFLKFKENGQFDNNIITRKIFNEERNIEQLQPKTFNVALK